MSHKDDKKLLPCPFCGSRAFFTYDANATQFIYARCSGCQSRTAAFFKGIDNGKSYEELAYRQASERWNRRQPIKDTVTELLGKAYALSFEEKAEMCEEVQRDD